jgi:trans-aconitate methyltransferase
MDLGDALHRDRRRAGSFGDDAELYDRARPPYPAELVDALMAERPHTVLDVGCGTGIASRLFSARGCQVMGLEPDSRMAAVARRQGAKVEEASFEQWDANGKLFDLLVSGQAWHWVDPHVGALKAAEVLHPGGRLGLFWNQSFPAAEARAVMNSVYERLAPALGESSVLIGRRDDSLYGSIADITRMMGSFHDVSIAVYGHDMTYSTMDWLDLATTHSDHRTLPVAALRDLLEGLRIEIDGIGGQVPVRYETTLVTGRRLTP